MGDALIFRKEHKTELQKSHASELHADGHVPRGSFQQEARECCVWAPEASADAPAPAYPVVLLLAGAPRVTREVRCTPWGSLPC